MSRDLNVSFNDSKDVQASIGEESLNASFEPAKKVEGSFSTSNVTGVFSSAKNFVGKFSKIVSSFLSLDDTPSSYSGDSGKVLVVNQSEDGLSFEGKAGSTQFTELTDTPSDYAGESGKIPVVNQSEDSLSFEEKVGFGGYSKGDFVPLFNFDVNSTTASTTSDTFTRVFSNVQPFAFSYESVYPQNVTPAVSMTITVSAQGDTIFYRLRNRQDNDVYLSGQKSGSTFQLVKLGPKKFVDDSTQDLDLHAIDIKNQDNSTQVQVFSASVRFGFIL